MLRAFPYSSSKGKLSLSKLATPFEVNDKNSFKLVTLFRLEA